MGKNNFIELGSLFGTAGSAFEIVELPISELSQRKGHRFRISPAGKRDLLRDSIEQFGVLHPILVRPQEDMEYGIPGKYEILSGHQRVQLSTELGKKTVPAIIKAGLTEDEAEQIVTETNFQRDWGEMSHSERAAVLSSHYNAQRRANIRKEVLEEINSYLQTYASPVNTRDEEGLSPVGTAGIREVAEDSDLSKNTIARYIRVDTLLEGVKLLLDDGEIPFRAAVELSYISLENQETLVSLINGKEYKCDINKAKLIRELQQKGRLNPESMEEVLSGSRVKKSPGKPKSFSISGSVMKKYERYFPPEHKKRDIEDIIDKALEYYFENRGSENGGI